MAGTSIQSDIKIDISAGNKLTGDAKAEFDQLRKSLLDSNNTAKDTQAIFLKMKEILDANSESASAFGDATNKIKDGLQSAASSAKATSEATGALKDQFTNVVSGLGNAYSVIRRIAFILPGIGISGIFALLGEGVIKLIAALSDLNVVEQAMDKINADVIKHLSDEVGKVQILSATILDQNTSRAEQKKAIQDLIDQHPNYFSNLKDQSNLTETLTEDTKKFTQAIEEEARIKAISTEITKLVAKQLEAEIDGKKDLDYWNKRINADLEDNNKDAVELDNQSAVLSRINTNKKIDDIQKQIDVYKTLGVVSEQTLTKLGGDTGKPKKGPKDNSLKEQQEYIAESQKILEDAEEKEITDENIKYEKIKADLEKFHHSTEALTGQHEQNISDIREKYELKREEEIQKLEAEMSKKLYDQNEKDALTFADQLTSHYQKQAEIGKTEQEKKIDAENLFYQKALESQMLFGGSTENLERQHQEALVAIDKEFQDKKDAQELKKRQQELVTGQRQVNSIIGQQRSSYANQKAQLDNYAAAVQTSYNKGEITVQQYNEDLQGLADARSQILSKEIGNYAGYAEEVGTSLTKIGESLGEQTEAGKDIAIAGSIISTIAGAIKAFEALASIPYIGPELGIAAAAAALVAGYANVAKIEAVQIPGQSGGSSSSTSGVGGGAATYTAPQIPTAVNTTNLTPQSINQIQSINQQTQPVRAYVVETDITQAQQRVGGYRDSNTI